MNKKIPIPFHDISQSLLSFSFPETDLIIGIGRGGVVPACMIAHQLAIPLKILRVNLRDEDNSPLRDQPILIGAFDWDIAASTRILLVDDVSVSGKTIQFIREKLKNYSVITFVLKGKADLVLFPNVKDCVDWPWKETNNVN